jgi:hypothetical protein
VVGAGHGGGRVAGADHRVPDDAHARVAAAHGDGGELEGVWRGRGRGRAHRVVGVVGAGVEVGGKGGVASDGVWWTMKRNSGAGEGHAMYMREARCERRWRRSRGEHGGDIRVEQGEVTGERRVVVPCVCSCGRDEECPIGSFFAIILTAAPQTH